jgi:predicted short-subunit dehydrogenase-like oxidoreductase (DUF2520 family)
MPKRIASKKPRVTIIGPGRLGTALAIALSNKGYQLEALIGRRASKLKKSAAFLDVPVQLLVTKDVHKLSTTDLVIVATPDDQISAAVDLLSESVKGITVLHTSGAISSKVLSPLGAQDCHVGSLHPLLSVSDPMAGAKAFKGAFWCAEGDRRALGMSKKLVHDLAGYSFTIRSTAKPLYHAAAVMASGNVVALIDVAIDMLTHCGLHRNEARRVVLPLLESTVANLKTNLPAKAMTGTFARGDLHTVEQHLRALSEAGLDDTRALYQLLGRKALKLSEANGLDRNLARRISTKLEE